MDLNSRFKLNDAEIASKVMDGEAIIISLSTGTYYSMDEAGGVIWELIARGYSVKEMVDFITRYYGAGSEDPQKDLEELFKNLTEEKIILLSNENQIKEVYQIPNAPSKLAYKAPRLNIYSDMKDLLALDPPMPKLDNEPWEDS